MPGDAHEQEQAEPTDGGDEDPAEEPPVPDIQVAAEQLSKLVGIALGRALNALKETQEKVFGEGGSVGDGSPLDAWLEEAQIWLACNNEVQAEIEDVRTAMQESLQEHEAQKAADDVPLVERPADFLRDRFMPTAGAGSSRAARGAPVSIARRITEFACHRAVFAGEHKAPLVQLAELERNCHRWYPNKGTSRFWEHVAEECTAAAAEVVGAPETLAREGWISCEQGTEGCTACAAALAKGEDAGAGASTSATAAASRQPRSVMGADMGAAVLAAVGAFAARKLPEVEREVYKMPEVPGQVPDVFGALDDPPGDGAGSDLEEVVFLETANECAAHRVEEVS